ncbi:MAG: hypothetical protein ACOY2B_05430, partial [Pseudomonadota bacterium]
VFDIGKNISESLHGSSPKSWRCLKNQFPDSVQAFNRHMRFPCLQGGGLGWGFTFIESWLAYRPIQPKIIPL